MSAWRAGARVSGVTFMRGRGDGGVYSGAWSVTLEKVDLGFRWAWCLVPGPGQGKKRLSEVNVIVC